ncbi:MAG TPA: hypothetical protein VHE30_16425 [Polyangiaceae bacterium]|nr:hypothetical protein [Polyangiaceae bacterium]
MSSARLGLATAAFAVACAGRPSGPAAAPGNASPAPATAASVERPPSSPAPTATPESHVDADAIVAEALEKASAVRELRAKGPVRGVTLTRARLAVQVAEAVDRELPPDLLRAEGEMLVLLGVVPADFDYRGAVVTLMAEELAGYYEPRDKTMYLAADLDAAARAATLSHELVHALQDQYFDLSHLLDFRPDESDALSAAHSLAEGDATSAMLDSMLAERGIRATDLSDALLGAQIRFATAISMKAPSVPDVLKRSLVAPYIDGTRLVNVLRRQGGWAAVDDVWKNPPTTTEQLLHEEKLRTHERALVLSIPPPAAGGPATRILSDVFGEQGLRLLFEEWLPEQVAEANAAGWGGDRGAIFHDDDRFALAWHFRADDAASADRQTDAFTRGVVAQGGTRQGAAACAERSDRGPLRVERRKRDIVVVAGPYRRSSGGARSAATCADAADWTRQIFQAEPAR